MTRRGQSGINVLLGIDKPVGCTSHDVVDQLRRVLQERRVGHAGTLDPAASGVMVVGVGQATRLLGLASAARKGYLARLFFGRETDTDDEQGRTTREAPAPQQALDPGFASESMGLVLAMRSQIPPAYSAISVGGKRAYVAARAGEEVELAERLVRVFSAQAVGTGTTDDGEPYWDVVLDVSKGTYVRAIARDLGRALGSACHLGLLRRLSSGRVRLPDCTTVDALADLRKEGSPLPALDPVAVLGLRAVGIDAEQVALVENGRSLRLPASCRDVSCEEQVALVYDGRLRAIAARSGALLVPRTVLVGGVSGVSQG